MVSWTLWLRFGIASIGCLGNTVSLVHFGRKTSKNSTTISLLALTIADLLGVLLALAASVDDILDTKLSNNISFLQALDMLRIVCFRTSECLTVFLGIERLYAVAKPLQVRLVFTKKVVLITIAIIYICLFGTFIPIIIKNYTTGFSSNSDVGSYRNISNVNKTLFTDEHRNKSNASNGCSNSTDCSFSKIFENIGRDATFTNSTVDDEVRLQNTTLSLSGNEISLIKGTRVITTDQQYVSTFQEDEHNSFFSTKTTSIGNVVTDSYESESISHETVYDQNTSKYHKPGGITTFPTINHTSVFEIVNRTTNSEDSTYFKDANDSILRTNTTITDYGSLLNDVRPFMLEDFIITTIKIACCCTVCVTNTATIIHLIVHFKVKNKFLNVADRAIVTKELRLVTTILAITLVYQVCVLLPIFFFVFEKQIFASPEEMFKVSYLCSITNSSVNIFIFLITSADYRNSLRIRCNKLKISKPRLQSIKAKSNSTS